MSEILTPEEVETLILSLVEARKERGATEDEMTLVVKWASQVKVDTVLLRGVLDKRILVDVAPDGEILFSLTEKGKRYVEEIKKNMGLPQDADIKQLGAEGAYISEQLRRKLN